jgi:hypothetical protein
VLTPATRADSGATIAQLIAASRPAGVPNPKSERAARSEQVRHRTNPPWWTCAASGCGHTVKLPGRAVLEVRHQGEFGKVFAPAPNAFTVSPFLLSSCSVFAGEQHAIPAVSACNRRASTQPCEFGAGHAFQSFPRVLPWILRGQILYALEKSSI